MRFSSRICAAALAAALALTTGSSIAANGDDSQTQQLNVDFGQSTGPFRGGASGTLYGLGDAGSPTSAILNGAAVENSSQKPPFGTQHPSGDVLHVEEGFFEAGGAELAVYLQDLYPDWSYNGGKRPGDTRSYVLDPESEDFGKYTTTPNNRWDYEEVTELVTHAILRNTNYPDQYTFIPFNEPDGGNWYWTDDDATNPLFAQTFLTDWDTTYGLIQKIWAGYVDGTYPVEGKRPTKATARIAGPGDTGWRQNRSDAFLAHTKAAGTLPEVFVWHELGKDSLRSYRDHYNRYRALEKKHGVGPLEINITEYGELRDMSVPGQLIQWFSMFEDTKVQAETAYWNYAGNLSDNMSRASAANGGWWLFKWYADLKGTNTVKVDPPQLNTIDTLQGLATIDEANRKATVLYGGATEPGLDAIHTTGSNIPVRVKASGLSQEIFGTTVDVVVREIAYTGTEGLAAAPRVVNVQRNVAVINGEIEITTNSTDRYAAYQLVVTPKSDATPELDAPVLVAEAETLELAGAQAFTKTPMTGGWGDFMFSGNGDVGAFGTGDTITWRLTAPQAGKYRLQVISGNPGITGTNKVEVNGVAAGQLTFGAELALKDSAKWKYRGSAELVVELAEGENQLALHGSELDNTVDKLLLYPITGATENLLDPVNYPATDLRLEDGAQLSYRDGAQGLASLNEGAAKSFINAWEPGSHELTISYDAAENASLSAELGGIELAEVTAQRAGRHVTKLTVALAEGINELKLSGEGILVENIRTASSTDTADAIAFEAEELDLSGTAQVRNAAGSNASGNGYVTGLGINLFETAETGAAGFGDRTRVKVLDQDNTPSVIEGTNGSLAIPEGEVPAGQYLVSVRFSNDTFIGRHDYNPQILDLGLQIREANQELAKSMFRYTYSDTSFLNGSLQIDAAGGRLEIGNFDPDESSGAAPNVDSLIFFPLISGEVTTEEPLEPNPSPSATSSPSEEPSSSPQPSKSPSPSASSEPRPTQGSSEVPSSSPKPSSRPVETASPAPTASAGTAAPAPVPSQSSASVPSVRPGLPSTGE